MDNVPIAFVVIVAILVAMLVWYLRDPKLVADGAVAAGHEAWLTASNIVKFSAISILVVVGAAFLIWGFINVFTVIMGGGALGAIVFLYLIK
ncbi:hypothetical protein [Pandoraea pnomenusa]|uniref:hypothetical protein n=1 Tax=Pandoraea pnomenusa TaxID=93220 RepID=UPI001AC7644F|nr:hypothetical protein [Pandoraea pnomenusa]MBN9093907.1 hypothetical protein [Pandoraea pnomenusa]